MSSDESIHDYEVLETRMKEHLDKLKKHHKNPKELDDFFILYKRWLIEKDKTIDWNKIEPLKSKIHDYTEELEHSLDNNRIKELLKKLAIIKLNGGLGTTMGLTGPKSAIKIKNDKNFIDLVVKQIKHLNKKYSVDVPLILMNSFNTDDRTEKMISKHNNIDIRCFNQAQFIKISEENFLPMSAAFSKSDSVRRNAFYPPGHGDLYNSLLNSGVLDQLIAEGKEYLFISNIDNLAATTDFSILNFIESNNVDFCLEVTKKTRADIKGGTLINYENNLKLLEIAMVPKNKISEVTSVKKFKIFNTNNLWLNLKALKKVIEKGDMQLDIITNSKVIDGENVIQLETAIGSAIKCFDNTAGILVPRSRFTPIKTCSDLFLCTSDLYEMVNGTLCLNKNRINQENLPVIKLIGKNFKKIKNFNESFGNIPEIVDLDVLAVTGNVTFGENVVLRGIVIICCPEGGKINIPDGSVLEDKVMFGNLPIIDC